MKKTALDYGIIVFKNGKFLVEDFGFILDERFEFAENGMTDTKKVMSYEGFDFVPGFNAKALTRGSYREVAYIVVSGIKFKIEDLGNAEDEDSEQFIIKFSYKGDHYTCLQGYNVGLTSHFTNKEKPLLAVRNFMNQLQPA